MTTTAIVNDQTVVDADASYNRAALVDEITSAVHDEMSAMATAARLTPDQHLSAARMVAEIQADLADDDGLQEEHCKRAIATVLASSPVHPAPSSFDSILAEASKIAHDAAVKASTKASKANAVDINALPAATGQRVAAHKAKRAANKDLPIAENKARELASALPTDASDVHTSFAEFRETTIKALAALDGQARLNRHKTRVESIVKMNVDKLQDEATRNFAIAREALLDCWEQHDSIPDYTKSDFDHSMLAIREEVRMFIPIKADSIQLAKWIRAYVMREMVRESITDLADRIPFHAWMILESKSFTWSAKDLTGTINKGWSDLIASIAKTYSAGPMKSETLRETIRDNENRLVALAKTAENPELAAQQLLLDKQKEKDQEVASSKAAVSDSINEALVKGHLDANNIVNMVETLAKTAKKTPPSELGANPATIDKPGIKAFIDIMYANGRITEMTYMRDRLIAAVAKLESARETSISIADGSTDSLATRTNREQGKSEAKTARHAG